MGSIPVSDKALVWYSGETKTDVFVIHSVIQSQSIDSITLTQNSELVIDNSLQRQAIDNITLTQNSALTINDIAQRQEISYAVLSIAHGTLKLTFSTDYITLLYDFNY